MSTQVGSWAATMLSNLRAAREAALTSADVQPVVQRAVRRASGATAAVGRPVRVQVQTSGQRIAVVVQGPGAETVKRQIERDVAREAADIRERKVREIYQLLHRGLV